MSVRRRMLVTVAAVAWVSACAIGPQEEPTALDVAVGDRSLPFEPNPGDEQALVEFTSSIYLLSEDDQLLAVTRTLDAGPGNDARLRALLDSLVDGPTDREVDAGLRSAIPLTTEVLAVAVEDGTATVDLSASFASIGGPAELRAVGQLILTGTTFPGVRAFALELEGAPTAIPLPDGALTEDPVTLRQFSTLLSSDAPRDEPR